MLADLSSSLVAAGPRASSVGFETASSFPGVTAATFGQAAAYIDVAVGLLGW